jgi:hypothetical protein
MVGCVGGLVATAGLIATDAGSLGDLMQHNEDGWLAAVPLTMGLSGIFGSAAIGCAIRDETPTPSHGSLAVLQKSLT